MSMYSLQSASTKIIITKSVESHDKQALENAISLESHSAIDQFILPVTPSNGLLFCDMY